MEGGVYPMAPTAAEISSNAAAKCDDLVVRFASTISGMRLFLLEHRQKNRVNAPVIWLTILLCWAWSVQ